jgi:hypothetical protein
MKTNLSFLFIIMPALFLARYPAVGQGTVFTYQGRVTANGTNFNGAGQFQFALVTSTNLNHQATGTANAPSGGYITGYLVTGGGNGYLTAPAVSVTGGGGSGATATASISSGTVNSISVATPGNGAYTSAPTVSIAPPPANTLYTTYWSNDGTSSAGSEPVAAISVGVSNGLFTIVLGDTTIPNMQAIGVSAFTHPNLQLRIWFNDGVNGFAALSPVQNLTPTPFAIVATSLAGVVDNNSLPTGVFSTIGGGGGNFIPVGIDHATISGGGGNSVNGGGGTVAGGNNNATSNFNATISGGANNIASGSAAMVGGGSENRTAGNESTIGGGQHNINKGDHSVIGGGESNYIETNANVSVIAGGARNTNFDSGSAIGGGEGNQIQANANDTTISGGGFNAIQTGAFSSTIGGGYQNQVQTQATESTIGGGYVNLIQSNAGGATISGGQQNQIQTSSYYSVIGGGNNNLILSDSVSATISGGDQNQIQSLVNDAAIGGGYANLIQSSASFSTIAGGQQNQVQSNAFTSTIGGGYVNVIQPSAFSATISGGQQNQVETNASCSTIGGGRANLIYSSALSSTISGGQQNLIQTNASYATLAGGFANAVNGAYATVPGGANNVAGGQYSFAAGQRAQATNDGSFVWADAQNATLSSTRNNQFSIRAGGGVVMNVSGSAGLNPAAVAVNSTSANGIGLVVNESSSDTSVLFANGGTGDIIKGLSGAGFTVFEVLNDGTVKSKGVVLTSDRNAKENFTTLDARAVLASVISMPVTEWNYKDDPTSKKHLGPMAQDFYHAFQLNGTDDKHISVVDEGGVALAAIQGLNQKLDEKEVEIKNLQQKLNRLQGIVSQLAAQQ